jgi:hypothetical protein
VIKKVSSSYGRTDPSVVAATVAPWQLQVQLGECRLEMSLKTRRDAQAGEYCETF